MTRLLPFAPATLIVKRQIGNLIAQVTIEENHLDELQITDHPVEQGAVITDHSFKRPAEVTIKAGWSNSSDQADGDLQFVQYTYGLLLDLQNNRQPFDILTGKRHYTNMLIQSLSTRTDQRSENSLFVVARCRQILMAVTQTVTLPAANVQADPSATAGTVKMGTVNLQPAPHINWSAVPPGVPTP